MLLSAVPLQSFAEDIYPVSLELITPASRPFILGVDDAYRSYVREYDEASEEWVNTDVWYYNAPTCGMELKMTYSNGSFEIISNDSPQPGMLPFFMFIISCRVYENPVAGGTVTASVETSEYWKGEKLKTSFTMDVVDRYVDSIEVLSPPAYPSFRGLNDYTLEGMRLELHYADGTSEIHTFEPSRDSAISYINGEYLEAACGEDEDFSGDTVPLTLNYLDCSADYNLPLYESPYAAIDIVSFDYDNDEFNNFIFSSLTVKVTKKDESSQTYTLNNFEAYDGEEDVAGKIEGHNLIINCNYYAKARHGITVSFIDVTDAAEVDTRTVFDKIFEKIMDFVTDFLFNKVYNLFNRLF